LSTAEKILLGIACLLIFVASTVEFNRLLGYTDEKIALGGFFGLAMLLITAAIILKYAPKEQPEKEPNFATFFERIEQEMK
jgi:hypothetical protein